MTGDLHVRWASTQWSLVLVIAFAPLVAAAGQESVSNETSVWRFADAEPLVDLNGVEYRSADLEGRFVLLDFWATWCAPCLAELPNLKQLRSKYSADEFLLLSISVEQTERRKLESFLQRHAMTWPQFFDNRGMNGELPKRFNVTAVPRTVVVDRQGRIVAVDLRGEELAAAIDALLSD